MSNRVNLCAKISKELHTKIKQEQVESEMNLHQYVEKILTDYYEFKENGAMKMNKMRTLAVQIDEELFLKLDEYIKRKGLKKKEFLIDLIENLLASESESVTEIESNI